MLNISNENIDSKIRQHNFSTLQNVEGKKSGNTLRRLMTVTVVITIFIMFLPWTQNIKTKGNVVTIRPNQRPQTINTIIGGQVEKWFVQEGGFVKKGDTVLQLTEVKDNYFDKNLLLRTKNQVDLKKMSLDTYDDKIINLREQLEILKSQKDLKLSQSKIKLEQAVLQSKSDSVAYVTSVINYDIAVYQFQRADSLYIQGLKSLTYLEGKNMKLQEFETYKIKANNNWQNSKTTLVNLKLEIANVFVKYEADFNKIQSAQFSTVLNKMTAESSLNKLENQFSNYTYRSDLYYVVAPKNGYIGKMKIGGKGEILKAGQSILTLMPEEYVLAVEIYINPVDLPLMKRGQKVRIQFDGWPAIVFSGWPTISHGTYGGEIYAIDQFISSNGKYRLMVKEDATDCKWPAAIRYGGGASAMIMLSDVSIWYELWRNINGFPPNYYNKKEGIEIKVKDK